MDLSATRMTELSDRVVTVGSEKLLSIVAIYGEIFEFKVPELD